MKGKATPPAKGADACLRGDPLRNETRRKADTLRLDLHVLVRVRRQQDRQGGLTKWMRGNPARLRLRGRRCHWVGRATPTARLPFASEVRRARGQVIDIEAIARPDREPSVLRRPEATEGPSRTPAGSRCDALAPPLITGRAPAGTRFAGTLTNPVVRPGLFLFLEGTRRRGRPSVGFLAASLIGFGAQQGAQRPLDELRKRSLGGMNRDPHALQG